MSVWDENRNPRRPKQKGNSMGLSDRDARISAAGVVQSVIASGAPADEWRLRSAYGLAMVAYMALRLQGKKPEQPARPKSFKER